MESTKECPVCQTFVSQVCHSVRGHTDSLSHHHMNTHTHILPIQLDEWMNGFFWHIETWSHRFSRCIYEDPQWVLSVLRGFACCRYRWCSACGSVQRLLLYCFMCVFSFSWERTGFVLFVSCDTLLPRYQFLCFIYFDAIFSLETDIISKQASLQYQSRKSKLSANYQIKSKLSAKTWIPVAARCQLSDKIQTISQDLNDRCSKMSCILVWKVVHRLSLTLSSFGLCYLSLGLCKYDGAFLKPDSAFPFAFP